MSTKFFQPFEKIYYKFGDEVSHSLFQNLTQYVDIVDQIKSQQAFYEDYTIKSGDRPDTLSTQLYGDQKYYWTFFLMNDDLRESGWPLKNEEVDAKTREFYPHRVLTIASDFSSAEGGYDFRVGRRVIGNNSGAHGTIIKRNLDLGQLIVDTTHDFEQLPDRTITLDVNSNGAADIQLTDEREFFTTPDQWVMVKTNLDDLTETVISGFTVSLEDLSTQAIIRSIPFETGNFRYDLVVKILQRNESGKYEDGEVISLFDASTGLEVQKRLAKETSQYLAVHHYENADGEWVDIDPAILYNDPTGNAPPSQSYPNVLPSGLTAITNLERVQKKNDDLKQIKVIKSDVVETVVKEFYRLMQER